jgi:hypothetical protein
MFSGNRASPARLLRAKELLHDSGIETISQSTRVAAAFDAIYLCCIETIGEPSGRDPEAAHPDPDVVLSAAKRLELSSSDVTLILSLMQWSVGFGNELPCLPDEATTLAAYVVTRTQASFEAGDHT